MDEQVSDTLSYRTKGRSEEWKLNVLYNQAVRRAVFAIEAGKPTHLITVKALEEGVVLDQVYIYKKDE